MVLIEKDDSNYFSGDGFSGWDYPMKDEDINFAVIKVDGRSPKKGYQVNSIYMQIKYLEEEFK